MMRVKYAVKGIYIYMLLCSKNLNLRLNQVAPSKCRLNRQPAVLFLKVKRKIHQLVAEDSKNHEIIRITGTNEF